MKVKNQYLTILEYLHLSFNKWPSIQYPLRVFLVLWKHNNGEHCWLGNDPEYDHWHPFTKRVSHRGSLLKGVGVQGVLYQSIINAKLTERKKLYENVHKQQGWAQAWEYCQAKPIQTLGRASQGVNWSWSQCIKSHHAQTSSGKELPSHFWNRNIVRSILPGLRRKRTGLLLSGPKSSFQVKINFAFLLEIKVPESGGRVERHRIHVACSSVWSFHSQWWFGLPCHLLVLVHCVFWSPVNAVIYQEILEHFMLPSADKLYGDADFIFQQDLAPVHTVKGTKSLFNDHGVTVLDCPAN